MKLILDLKEFQEILDSGDFISHKPYEITDKSIVYELVFGLEKDSYKSLDGLLFKTFYEVSNSDDYIVENYGSTNGEFECTEVQRVMDARYVSKDIIDKWD